MWLIDFIPAFVGGYCIGGAFRSNHGGTFIVMMMIGIVALVWAWHLGDMAHASSFTRTAYAVWLGIATLAGISQRHGEF